MIKVIAIGIIAVLGAVMFKTEKPEYSIYIMVTATVLIGAFCIAGMQEVMQVFTEAETSISPVRGYFGVILKMVGITYLCETAANICKDCGYQSIAGQIDIFGKICVLLCGIPLIMSLLEILQKFV